VTSIKRFAKIRHWHRRGDSYTASTMTLYAVFSLAREGTQA